MYYTIQEHSEVVKLCPLPHEQQIVAHLQVFLNEFWSITCPRALRTRHFRSRMGVVNAKMGVALKIRARKARVLYP